MGHLAQNVRNFGKKEEILHPIPKALPCFRIFQKVVFRCFRKAFSDFPSFHFLSRATFHGMSLHFCFPRNRHQSAVNTSKNTYVGTHPKSRDHMTHFMMLAGRREIFIIRTTGREMHPGDGCGSSLGISGHRLTKQEPRSICFSA